MPNTPDTRNYPAYAQLVKEAFKKYEITERNPYNRTKIEISYNPEKDLPLLANAIDIAISTLATSESQVQRRRAHVIERVYILQRPDDTAPEEPQTTRPLSVVAARLLKKTHDNRETSLLGVQPSRIAAIRRDGLNSVASLMHQDPSLSRFFRQIDQ